MMLHSCSLCVCCAARKRCSSEQWRTNETTTRFRHRFLLFFFSRLCFRPRPVFVRRDDDALPESCDSITSGVVRLSDNTRLSFRAVVVGFFFLSFFLSVSTFCSFFYAPPATAFVAIKRERIAHDARDPENLREPRRQREREREMKKKNDK